MFKGGQKRCFASVCQTVAVLIKYSARTGVFAIFDVPAKLGLLGLAVFTLFVKLFGLFVHSVASCYV